MTKVIFHYQIKVFFLQQDIFFVKMNVVGKIRWGKGKKVKLNSFVFCLCAQRLHWEWKPQNVFISLLFFLYFLLFVLLMYSIAWDSGYDMFP